MYVLIFKMYARFRADKVMGGGIKEKPLRTES